MGGLAALFGGFVIFVVVLFAAAALIPVALAYVALRVRDARAAEPDPRLGAKTAFHLIHSLGVLMALTGLTVSAIDLMSGTLAKKPPVPAVGPGGRAMPAPAQKEGGFNAAQRTAVALVGVGTLFALVFWGFLLGTNDRTHRSVWRVFAGGRMALCLLVMMTTVAALAAVLIQKDPEFEVAESLLGIVLVWFPAAVVHMLLFQAATREARTRRAGRDDEEAWTPHG